MTQSEGRALRVAYVTAGGAGMFCGSCMHDNTLVRALRALGHDAVLLPAFTPIRTDETDVSEERVIFGGVNVYMAEQWPMWNRLPKSVRGVLDRPRFLEWISARALETRRDDDGWLAASMLRGTEGRHREETLRVVEQLLALDPDVVVLTNLLIAGFVPELKRRNAELRVVVTLQGDDIFLDALPADQQAAVIEEMRRVNRSVDAFTVMSAYYRDFMAEMLDEPHERFRIVPLGVETADFIDVERPVREGRTVAYLSRICPEKGFDLLIDAFLHLRRDSEFDDVELRVAGWLGQDRRAFYEAQKKRLSDAGLSDSFKLVDVPDRAAKAAFLAAADVFTVPAKYREPKGLPVLEALACGTPVVQPAHGAYPELLETVGGGRLFPPGDAAALATTLGDLLRDDEERRRLGGGGRRRILSDYDAPSMARRHLDMYRTLTDSVQ